MNKTFTSILTGILMSMVVVVTMSEAQIMKSKGLSAKQEKIVAIAAFTASGDLQKLQGALNAGLDAGLTINEIKEILVQLYAYTGFPRSLNGINAFIGVMGRAGTEGHQG
jgi:4-carboxymuconolactone decarboxylase